MVLSLKSAKMVALRKESVDRNLLMAAGSLARSRVALRKESVDRNGITLLLSPLYLLSLSARRAWIEIILMMLCTVSILSLSARRAWIEIIMPDSSAPGAGASLSARRAWIEIPNAHVISEDDIGRSPQGERG